MNLKFTKTEKQFLGRLVLATGIAWPVGIILAIVLSYAVVNQFYPKETNLIVGLCLGALVGYSQWFVLKKYFKISTWWIWASTIGIGLPFVAEVNYLEFSGSENSLIKSEFLGQIIVLSIGGLLTGLFQLKIIKALSKRSIRWIIISTLAWGISWAGFFLGGVILGLIIGLAMLRLLELSVQEEPVKVG
ncbi:MAG: hypothetical protein WCS69_10495 [Ignavibacteriaceae bacterium]|jgi:hypothetical protein